MQQQGGGDINDLEHNDRFSIRTTRTKQSKMKEETRSTQVVRQPLKRNTIITSLRTDDNNISKNHASSSTLIVKQPSEVVVNSSKKQIIRGQPESVYNSSTIQQQQTSPLQAPVSLIPSFSRNDRAVEPTTKEYHALQASSVIPFSFNTMFGDEKLNSGTTNSDTYGGTNTRIRGDHIIVNQRGNTLRSNTDRLDEMKTELRNLENSKSLSGIEKKVSLKLEIEQLESQDFSEKSLDSLPDSTKKKEEPIKPPKATSIPSFSSSISSIHQRNYADDFD